MNPADRSLRLGGWMGVVAFMIAIGVTHIGDRIDSNADAAVDTPRFAHTWVESLRGAPGEALGDGEVAALVKGVVFGQPGELSAPLRDDMRTSGLWHLVAASGQNIALVVLLATWFAIGCGGTKVHGMWLSLAAIPAYVIVVGGGPSIMRAGTMGMLAVAAWLVSGRIRAPVLLTWSAVLLELLFPGIHGQLGFQLSYACVAGLLWLAPRLYGRMVGHGMAAWIAAPAAATAVCQVVTAPLLLLHIGDAPLIGGVSNFLGIPLASAILVVGLSGALIGVVVPPAGETLLVAAGGCAWLLARVAEVAAQLPWAAGGVREWLACSTLAVGVYAAVRSEHVRARVRLMWGAAAVVVAVWSAGYLPVPGSGAPAGGAVAIDVLDVGQGDAILVRSGIDSLLVDAGPSEVMLRRALRRVGVAGHPDHLAISHRHADHDGGADAIRTEPAHAGPGPNELCRGARMRLGPASVDVLSPACRAVRPGTDANDHSLVLLVRAHGRSVLLTGDAESQACRCAVAGGVDVLKVAHHGSRDDGLSQLVSQLRPRAAVISVGQPNRYGHPHPATIEVLRSHGVRTFRTDQHGDIRIQIHATGELIVAPVD